jgi:hypothetical protein
MPDVPVGVKKQFRTYLLLNFAINRPQRLKVPWLILL